MCSQITRIRAILARLWVSCVTRIWKKRLCSNSTTSVCLFPCHDMLVQMNRHYYDLGPRCFDRSCGGASRTIRGVLSLLGLYTPNTMESCKGGYHGDLDPSSPPSPHYYTTNKHSNSKDSRPYYTSTHSGYPGPRPHCYYSSTLPSSTPSPHSLPQAKRH